MDDEAGILKEFLLCMLDEIYEVSSTVNWNDLHKRITVKEINE